MPHKPPPKRPSRFLVRNSEELLIEWRWYAPSSYVLLIFVYLPLLVVAAWALTTRAEPDGLNPDWATTARCGLLLVTLLATWFIAAAFVNRTTIRVSPESVSMVHAPLWCPGNKRFPTADVAGFAVEIDRSGQSEDSDEVRYKLMVNLRSSFPRTLLTRIPDEAEAEYLKRKLAAKVQAYASSATGSGSSSGT